MCETAMPVTRKAVQYESMRQSGITVRWRLISSFLYKNKCVVCFLSSYIKK